MNRFLLDTNTISNLMKNPNGSVRSRLEAVGETDVCTSVIVAAELRFGAAKTASARLMRQVELVLGAIEVLPFAPPADQVCGQIRADLQARGTPIGGNDVLIAAHALSHDLILVTDNIREFARVDGLQLENWLQRPDEH